MPPDDPAFGRWSEIEELAESISARHFPHEKVEPERLAKNAGIAFAYASFPEEFDGVLHYEDQRFFIVLNDRRHPRGSPRSRFTFAHEYGHFAIPHHRAALIAGTWPTRFSRTEFTSTETLEREADLFAATLLLPRQAVSTMAGRIPPGLPQVYAVSEAFGTSLTATAYRLLDLDLFPTPAAVYRWDVHGQLVSRAMRREIHQPNRRDRRMVDRPPEGSPTAEAIARFFAGSQQAVVPAWDWFPDLSGLDPNEPTEVNEEVISLGEFGWLTIVTS